MITMREIAEAKTDPEVRHRLFEKMFPGKVLDAWLQSQGIYHKETREDYVMDLYLVFVKMVERNKDMSSPFEAKVWLAFKRALINFETRKKDVNLMDDCDVVVDIGRVDIGFGMDLETISEELTPKSARIMHLMAKGYLRRDMEQLGISPKAWDRARPEIADLLMARGLA